ncbi:hypothetical protein CSW58_09645 [Caulobacter sp. B11]|nr:hypothetical protein CSW58_09645 [Caulobacter sp. B11]
MNRDRHSLAIWHENGIGRTGLWIMRQSHVIEFEAGETAFLGIDHRIEEADGPACVVIGQFGLDQFTHGEK